MSKPVDINVSRSITIQPAQFEGIRPYLSLSVRDIDPEKLAETYEIVDDLVSDLFRIETARCLNNYYEAKQDLPSFFDSIVADYENILHRIKENGAKLGIEVQNDQENW